MRVFVCGSRTRRGDASTMMQVFARLAELPAGSEVWHGGADGPDKMAGLAAREFGFTEREFPADWVKYGKRAGVIRSVEALDEKPDVVLAFWDGWSRGTRHTIHEAQRRGIPVEVHQP